MFSGEVEALNVLERFSTKCKCTRTLQLLLPASKHVPSSQSFVFQIQVLDPLSTADFFFLLGSTDAVSKQISYLEFTRDKQSWKQSTQSVSAKTTALTRQFAMRVVSPTKVTQTTCRGVQLKQDTCRERRASPGPCFALPVLG